MNNSTSTPTIKSNFSPNAWTVTVGVAQGKPKPVFKRMVSEQGMFSEGVVAGVVGDVDKIDGTFLSGVGSVVMGVGHYPPELKRPAHKHVDCGCKPKI